MFLIIDYQCSKSKFEEHQKTFNGCVYKRKALIRIATKKRHEFWRGCCLILWVYYETVYPLSLFDFQKKTFILFAIPTTIISIYFALSPSPSGTAVSFAFTRLDIWRSGTELKTVFRGRRCAGTLNCIVLTDVKSDYAFEFIAG